MPLSDTAVRQAKLADTPYKMADSRGLYLLVNKAGKYWRWNYRHLGKQKTLAYGAYPDVSLAAARDKHQAARSLLAAGTDPGQAKQEKKRAAIQAEAHSFEAVAREYHRNKSPGWSASYSEKWLRLMEKNLFPYIGRSPLPQITPPVLLAALRRVEARGAIDAAHTIRQNAGQVFRYGVQTGRCERSPVPDLQDALKPVVVTHMAAILEPASAGELLRSIDHYTGQAATRAALQLSALLLLRPGNIRQLEWAWIDMEQALLSIPAQAMKRTLHGKVNGRPHFVPLPPQAIEVLREIQPLSGHGRYVFPSLLTGERPMSENTVNMALRRMGFTADEMTAHGFRAMARTLIVERIPGILPDVIEAQLAHGKSGPLGMAYDRAEFMEQRRKMMLVWADYLDKLRRGADVVPLSLAA